MKIFRKLLSVTMNLFWRRNRSDLSEKAARLYCRWFPKDPFGWGIWGQILGRLKRIEEAEEVLRKGLALHPNDSDIPWLLSHVLMLATRYEEAEGVLTDLLETHPDSYLPYLGMLELSITKELIGEAMDWAKKVEERIEPKEFGKMYELAVLLGLANQPETCPKAITLLERVTTGWPRYAPAHFMLGVLIEKDDEEKAFNHFDLARRYWDSPRAFDEALERERKSIGKYSDSIRQEEN